MNQDLNKPTQTATERLAARLEALKSSTKTASTANSSQPLLKPAVTGPAVSRPSFAGGQATAYKPTKPTGATGSTAVSKPAFGGAAVKPAFGATGSAVKPTVGSTPNITKPPIGSTSKPSKSVFGSATGSASSTVKPTTGAGTPTKPKATTGIVSIVKPTEFDGSYEYNKKDFGKY